MAKSKKTPAMPMMKKAMRMMGGDMARMMPARTTKPSRPKGRGGKRGR